MDRPIGSAGNPPFLPSCVFIIRVEVSEVREEARA